MSYIQGGYGNVSTDFCNNSEYQSTYSLLNEECWNNHTLLQCYQKLEELHVHEQPVNLSPGDKNDQNFSINLAVTPEFDFDLECFSQTLSMKSYFSPEAVTKIFQVGGSEYDENDINHFYYNEEDQQIKFNLSSIDLENDYGCKKSENDNYIIYDCIAEYYILFSGRAQIEFLFNIQVVQSKQFSAEIEVSVNSNQISIDGEVNLGSVVQSTLNFCLNFECEQAWEQILGDMEISSSQFTSYIDWSNSSDIDLHLYALSDSEIQYHVYYSNKHQDLYYPRQFYHQSSQISDGELEGRPFEFLRDRTDGLEGIDEEITINFEFLPRNIDTLIFSVYGFNSAEGTTVIVNGGRDYEINDGSFVIYQKLVRQSESTWKLYLIETQSSGNSNMGAYAQNIAQQAFNNNNTYRNLQQGEISIERREKFYVAHTITTPGFENYGIQGLSIKMGIFQPIIHREEFKFINGQGAYIYELESLAAFDSLVLSATAKLLYPVNDGEFESSRRVLKNSESDSQQQEQQHPFSANSKITIKEQPTKSKNSQKITGGEVKDQQNNSNKKSTGATQIVFLGILYMTLIIGIL